jgi:malonyl-CoA/methylmalonyl-CoA synthetase
LAQDNDNLFAVLRARFAGDPARPCFETADGQIMTYGQMEAESGRFARLLADLGVGPGDRVAVQVDKSPQVVCLYLAVLRVGAVYLPLNTAYLAEEIAYFLSDAEPAVVVARPQAETAMAEIAARTGGAKVLTLGQDRDGSLVERSRGLDPDFGCADCRLDDLAALLYTSGTTGRAKGAMLSHGNLGSNALTLHRVWGFQPGDVLLHALPIFHTHGLFVATNCALLNASKMLFLPKFDAAEVIGLLPSATVMMGVPTFYVRLLADPAFDAEVCRNMRLFISGSAPLLEETFEQFRTRSGHTILERYGMTETGMSTSNPLEGARIGGTVGLPLPDVAARVTGETGQVLAPGETGILEVRGPNVFHGYWRQPERTKEEFRADGFFITGDIARIDGDGYVRIVGRAKDLIISGGFNVYPKEVELVIDQLGGVAESAVIGLAHPDFGEAVTAVVKPAPGQDAPGEAEVIAAAKAALANYKVPKRVFFIDDLPRNSMGKVQKNLLRERYKDAF